MRGRSHASKNGSSICCHTNVSFLKDKHTKKEHTFLPKQKGTLMALKNVFICVANLLYHIFFVL